MHILVTGVGGFIGRVVVRRARARGWDVTGVARRPCPEADRIADLRQPIEGWPAPDAVIHLAGAYAGCGARELAQTDLAMARNLLTWGSRSVRRWVFASAAEVYGDIAGEAGESWPCRPVIPFGRAKLEIERMFQAAELPELAICRLGEVYGPDSRILSELGGRLRRGFCPWPGDGEVKISFLHVEDAAEALLLAVARGSGVYNVGDCEPATWRQFLDSMAELLCVRRAIYLPLPVARCYAALASWADRAVTPHVLRLLTTPKVLSSARIRDELGFVPRYPAFRAGLEEALRGL
ncbi:MAG: NAD(P)-dependent oxidoreductase [Bryobacteraceae bacterium]